MDDENLENDDGIRLARFVVLIDNNPPAVVQILTVFCKKTTLLNVELITALDDKTKNRDSLPTALANNGPIPIQKINFKQLSAFKNTNTIQIFMHDQTVPNKD